MNPTFPRPPRDVLTQFFESQPASIELIAPGLSGARVWRVREDDNHPTSWALRKWPAGTSAARVQQIDLLVQRALDHEFPFFPALRMTRNRNRRLTDANQYVWECRQWMPGQPPRDDADTLMKCGAQLASASARFSLSTGEQTSAHARTPASTAHAFKKRLQHFLRTNKKDLGSSRRLSIDCIASSSFASGCTSMRHNGGER